MIPYEDALGRILEHLKPLPETTMEAQRALGLRTTRPVKARLRMPRFDQSAMDGIAVRLADLAGVATQGSARLALRGELPAGSSQRRSLRSGTAVKVFTGGPLPTGTEAVIKVEDCEFGKGFVDVLRAGGPGQHIRRAGEEVRRGDLLLPAGTKVTPPVIGLLVSFGVERIRVHRRPVVGVLTMGDELRPPGTTLRARQCFDSNGPALTTALRWMGVEETRTARVGDEPRQLARALGRLLRSCDLVLTVGGASVGEHDHVRAARASVGIKEIFDRVAIKPGKPNHFGIWRGRKPVLSLPGNPVSALVSFHQLVRPALWRMMGRPADSGEFLTATLDEPVRSSRARLEWTRVSCAREGEVWHVRPLPAQGSHMLTGLASADALLEVPVGVDFLPAGATVRVIPLRWQD